MIEYQADVGLRGIGAQTFGLYQGVEYSDWKYLLDMYQTDTPLLFTSILGPDTKSGTASPYTHTFNLASAEPSSICLHDYDGYEEWVLAGSRMSAMNIKFDVAKNLTADIQGQGFPHTTTTKETPSVTAEQYYMGWQAALKIAGSSNYHLVSMQLNMTRKLQVRHSAQNSQAPTYVFVGPLEVAGSITFDVEDDTEFNYYANNTQPSVVVTFTDGSNSLKFQMSTCAFKNPTRFTSGTDWLQLDASFTAVYNTTDSGPIEIVAVNSRATAY